MRVTLHSDDAAVRLGSRCILIRAIYEFWAQGMNIIAMAGTMLIQALRAELRRCSS